MLILREGMPIQGEKGCQYEGRRDADVKECDTEGAGMPMSKSVILREQGCRY
jgi:hypothetical protein